MKVLFVVVSHIRVVNTSLDFASTLFFEAISHIFSILGDDETQVQESIWQVKTFLLKQYTMPVSSA
jgi:hypothetical protein